MTLPPRPTPGTDWNTLGGALHDAVNTFITAVPQVRDQLTTVQAAVAAIEASSAPKANPSFTGTVSGITKSMVGLGNVPNLSPSAMTFSAAQFTSGVLAPARLPDAVPGVRRRTPANEKAPTTSNWEARPVGYPFVLNIGAAPAPSDALAVDLHVPTYAAQGTPPATVDPISTAWAAGSITGRWAVETVGGGQAGSTSSSRIQLRPAAGQTARVASTTTTDGDVTVRAQVRALTGTDGVRLWWNLTREAPASAAAGTPVVSGYARKGYSITLRPGGWDIVKTDTDAITAGTRVLASGTSPVFPAGASWRDVTIVQAGAAITVTVDGSPLPTVTDGAGSPGWNTTETILTSGAVGLSATDSTVEAAQITVTSRGTLWTWWPDDGTPGGPVPLTDGSSFAPIAGTRRVDGTALIGRVNASILDTTTYNAYISAFPREKWLTGIRTAARNVVALLYGTTYTPPVGHQVVTLEFTGNAGIAARSGSKLTFGTGSRGASVTASYTTHEVVHLLQGSAPLYGSNAYVTGLYEGIADWVLIQLGYHTVAGQRPAGGGTSWWAGYDTTAFFLDWVEKTAGGGSPGFVAALNQTLSSSSWTPAAATSLNTQGKTLDALWTDYKAYLAA